MARPKRKQGTENIILIRHGLTAVGDMDKDGVASVHIRGLDNTSRRVILSLSKADLEALMELRAKEAVYLAEIGITQEAPGDPAP